MTNVTLGGSICIKREIAGEKAAYMYLTKSVSAETTKLADIFLE